MDPQDRQRPQGRPQQDPRWTLSGSPPQADPAHAEHRLPADLCPSVECCCGETAAYLDWVMCCRKDD